MTVFRNVMVPAAVLALLGCPLGVLVASVPYPPVAQYQARTYARHAAECLARLGPSKECARLLETSLMFAPDQATTQHTLAWLYYQLGEAGKALAGFATTLRLDPKRTDALWAMGELYLEQGKLSLAENKFKQYQQVAPNNPLGDYGLATLAAMNGDGETAFRWLESAVKKGFVNLETLVADPRWKTLANDPRFSRLQRQASAPRRQRTPPFLELEDAQRGLK